MFASEVIVAIAPESKDMFMLILSAWINSKYIANLADMLCGCASKEEVEDGLRTLIIPLGETIAGACWETFRFMAASSGITTKEAEGLVGETQQVFEEAGTKAMEEMMARLLIDFEGPTQ